MRMTPEAPDSDGSAEMDPKVIGSVGYNPKEAREVWHSPGSQMVGKEDVGNFSGATWKTLGGFFPHL